MRYNGINFRRSTTVAFRFAPDGTIEFYHRKTGTTIPVSLAGSNYGYVDGGPQDGRVLLAKDGHTYTAPAKPARANA